jgi:threonine dehydratase
VALAAQISETQAEVFVPEYAVARKVDAMRALGAQVHFVEGGYAEAEAAGGTYASAQHKSWVSPYNDGQVIAGQGTLALEILEDLPEPVNAWVVPVGGGGLAAGIGAALGHISPRPRLIGVQSEASAFAYNLYHHGSQEGIQELPTLADGLSGAVEEGSLTIPMMKELMDDILLVSEEQIAHAIAFAWHEYGEVVEGSSAVTLAAILTDKVRERPVVAVITGGNIQPEVHAQIVARFAEKSWI